MKKTLATLFTFLFVLNMASTLSNTANAQDDSEYSTETSSFEDDAYPNAAVTPLPMEEDNSIQAEPIEDDTDF